MNYDIPNLSIDFLLYQMQQIMYDVHGGIIQILRRPVENESYTERSKKDETIKKFFRSSNPIDLNEILPHVQTFLVTEEIQGKEHRLMNIFTRTEETAKVPNPFNYEIEDEKGLALLGCYTPDNGAIYLWIDKFDELVCDFCDYKYLVFQKVLLHEFIHLLFDVIRKTTNLQSMESKAAKEETKDNLLVLNCYANSCADSTHSEPYKNIRRFIEQQPAAYCDAINEFESDASWFTIRNNITNFLFNTNPYKYELLGRDEG